MRTSVRVKAWGISGPGPTLGWLGAVFSEWGKCCGNNIRMIWWAVYLSALLCLFQLLAISIASGSSTFCNHGHCYISLYPSQLMAGRKDLPIAPWSTAIIPSFILGFDNLRVKRNELCSPLAWRPHWVASIPESIRHDFVPIWWKFFYEKKNKNWLSCSAGLDFLPWLQQAWLSNEAGIKTYSSWVGSL